MARGGIRIQDAVLVEVMQGDDCILAEFETWSLQDCALDSRAKHWASVGYYKLDVHERIDFHSIHTETIGLGPQRSRQRCVATSAERLSALQRRGREPCPMITMREFERLWCPTYRAYNTGETSNQSSRGVSEKGKAVYPPSHFACE